MIEQEFKKARAAMKKLRFGPKVPVAKQREIYEDFFAVPRISCNIDFSREVIPSDNKNLSIDVLKPEFLFGAVSVLYIHDGAFTMGSPLGARNLCCSLANESGATIYIPEYRLAPEHPFPSAMEDIYNTYQYLYRQNKTRVSNIVIAGSGSGGALALSLTGKLREMKLPLPKALVLFSPWGDITCSSPEAKNYRKEDPFYNFEYVANNAHLYTYKSNFENPLVSPVFQDFSGFPPVFLQCGTREIFFPDFLKIYRKAEEAGVKVVFDKWEGMWHLFQSMDEYTSQARLAVIRAGEWIKSLSKSEDQ